MASTLPPAHRARLKVGALVSITITPRGAYTGGTGYVRAVHADSFDFDYITNPGAVFSNYSEPESFERQTFRFDELVAVVVK